MSEGILGENRSIATSAIAPVRAALGTRALANRPKAAEPAAANFAGEAPAQTEIPWSPTFEPKLHVGLVLFYLFASFAAQLILLLPAFARFRVELRLVPFGISLLFAAFPLKDRVQWLRLHPAFPLAAIACCIVAFGLLNQDTDSLLSGMAQTGLTIAIVSPLLWVGRLRIGVRGFALIVLCLWGFNAVSAGFGVLQVVFPGHFQPATSSIVEDAEEAGITQTIELADGTEISRPYGLTDQPGGAAAAGLMAFVLGLGLLVASTNIFVRVLYLGGMGVGLFVMYLSQVRVSIVVSGVAIIAFVVIMAMRGEMARLTGAMLSLAVVIFISTTAAFAIGGSSTRDRLFTLVDDSASDVYYNNRGHFLDYTFNWVLPMYPMGAGLGRYGMMSHYFSRDANGSNSLWAEIQWTAWAYDGGYLLVIEYPLAILLTCWIGFKIGRNPMYGPVGLWAAILTSYNIAVISVIFSYPFFESQGGMEWWLLNAALFSAAQVYLRSLKPEVPEGFEVIPAPWRPGIAASPGTDNPGASKRRRPLEHRPLPAVVPVFDASVSGEAQA